MKNTKHYTPTFSLTRTTKVGSNVQIMDVTDSREHDTISNVDNMIIGRLQYRSDQSWLANKQTNMWSPHQGT